jgi:hypothetical protein
MKANEFKIGNYHYYHMEDKLDERKEWDEVCVIDAEDLVWLSSEKGKRDTDYSPIPLTEEWLRKLHSEDELEKSARFPNEITIYDRFLFIWKKEYKYWYVVTAYHKEYLTKIEFVHEYQNFIIILTDTELTIKKK